MDQRFVMTLEKVMESLRGLPVNLFDEILLVHGLPPLF